MSIDFVGRAVFDIDAAAVGLPSRNAGREPVVGISNAAVMLFLIFVLFGVGSRIAAQPELFDELLALVVRASRLNAFRSSSVMM